MRACNLEVSRDLKEGRMSEQDHLLQRFKLEVFNHGPEACLPVNLSEEWSAILSRAIDRYLADSDDSYFKLVTAALLGILFGKSRRLSM